MPWKETTTMSQRKAFVEEASKPDRNMSQLCREYQISRKTGYKWLRRYEGEGEQGLEDRSRRPKHSPRKTTRDVETAVLNLRKEHPAWGGRKLNARLKHLGHEIVPGPSTITAILQRHDCISEEESQKRKAIQRFEKDRPNEMWQMDFKGSFAIAQQDCYPLTVLDDCSRFLVGLRACHNQQKETVKQQLTDIFCQYGLPESILTDNGAPWGPSHGHRYYTQLIAWLIRLGVRVIRSRPYHPQTLGKDERLHRSLQAEVISRYCMNSFEDCQAHFDTWQQIYNTQRPHEALDLLPPVSHYQPSPRPFPEILPPIEYPEDAIIRMVHDGGRISFQGTHYRVGRAFDRFPVGLFVSPDQDSSFDVYFCHQKIKTISVE
jgi:transposase InsO family protein